jgi:hypothetical protein
METAYTVFYPDGRADRRTIDWPENPTLAQLKALIDPIVEGDLEHVAVIDPAKVDDAEIDPGEDRRDLFVDELSVVRDKPRNDAATAIYRANWLRGNPDTDPQSLPWIGGTAVLFDRIIWR